jgi:hypothetical protein
MSGSEMLAYVMTRGGNRDHGRILLGAILVFVFWVCLRWYRDHD